MSQLLSLFQPRLPTLIQASPFLPELELPEFVPKSIFLLSQSDPFISPVPAAISLSCISHSMKFWKPDTHPKIFPSFFVGGGKRQGLFSSWTSLALNTCFYWKESSIGIEDSACTPRATPTHWGCTILCHINPDLALVLFFILHPRKLIPVIFVSIRLPQIFLDGVISMSGINLSYFIYAPLNKYEMHTFLLIKKKKKLKHQR